MSDVPGDGGGRITTISFASLMPAHAATVRAVSCKYTHTSGAVHRGREAAERLGCLLARKDRNNGSSDAVSIKTRTH